MGGDKMPPLAHGDIWDKKEEFPNEHTILPSELNLNENDLDI